MLVGYLWNAPHKYQKLKSQKLVDDTFTDDRWGYYYFLGKEMFDNGIRSFDDKTIYSYLDSKHKSSKKNWFEEYENYGGFDVIGDLMNECSSYSNNEEYHLQEVQKYAVLRSFEKENFINTTDEKLVDKLCKMNLKQVRSFFQYKFSTIFSNVNHGEVIESNLLDEGLIDEAIDEMDEGDVMGLQLHDAPRLNYKIKGWRKGVLAYLVLASGVGKTSFGFEKFILSLIENKKKGLIFANEENSKKFIRLMLATVAARILKTPINRERMSKGGFDKDGSREKLNNAKKWIAQNHPDMIKFFHLKKYRLEDITNRIEMYRPLGYEYCFIDTFKPESGGGEAARWERFSENAQELHDCIKEDANNMGTIATVQLKIGKEYRFLDLSVIGKSNEIVETAGLVMAGRMMYDDEYPPEEGKSPKKGDKPLKPYNYKDGQQVPYKVDRNKEYMILFLPKNREGGKDEQILYEVNYGLNSWNEVAYVQVPRVANTMF